VDFRDRVDRILKSSTKTFGEQVTYYPKVGGVVQIQAIFDHDYQAIDPNTEQVISANQPALGVNLNDIKFSPAQGDQVKIRNVTYRVVDAREDGQGGATLLLNRLDERKKVNSRAIA
jgi:hypothetical protein